MLVIIEKALGADSSMAKGYLDDLRINLLEDHYRFLSVCQSHLHLLQFRY